MITKKDIYEALGVQTSDHFMTGMLVGIGIGALVGSAVAMLLAPKSGSEIRRMISEKTSDLVEGAKTKIGVGTKNNGGELHATPPRPGEPGRF